MNFPTRDWQKRLALHVSWSGVPCRGRSHSGVPKDAGFPGRYVVPLRKQGPTFRRILPINHDYPSNICNFFTVHRSLADGAVVPKVSRRPLTTEARGSFPGQPVSVWNLWWTLTLIFTS